MARNAQKNGIDREVNRTPAGDNVWYVMATLGGIPSSVEDMETINTNADYWNALMYYLFPTRIDKCQIKEVQNLIEPTLAMKAISILKNKSNSLPKIGAGFKFIDFEKIEFANPTYFQKFIFPFTVHFSESNFVKEVDFSASYFLAGTSFKSSQFHSDTKFVFTYFHGGPDFQLATFYDRCHFQAARFVGQPQFSNTTFRDTATFSIAQFEDFVSFNNSTFLGAANFRHVKYSKTATFGDVEFHGKSLFDDSENVTNTSFRNAKFYNHPPVFSDGEKLELMQWNNNIWPEKPPSKLDANDHIDSYERLSLAMGKIQKTQYQHNFKLREMKARRVAEKNPFVKLTYGIYEVCSNYGYGYKSALMWWSLNIIVGSMFLFPFKSYKIVAPTYESVWLGVGVWSKSIVVSFSNAHSFFGLFRGPFQNLYKVYSEIELIVPFNAVWGGQAILGVLFTFFMGLTLRNKFRA